MMQHRRKFAALLSVGLLAAACGGDDTTTETPDPVTTEATDGDATDGDATDDRSDWPEKIVLGLVPSREADVLVESAAPLGDAMAAALGIEVETFVPDDYTALTEAMRAGQADLGAFGPLGMVRAIERADAEFILQSSRFGSFTYHTQYMTNNPDKFCDDTPVADEDGALYCNGTLEADEGPVGADAIAKIDGKLAFVDPTSTSGYLIPALQMIEAGIDIEALDSTFAGGHDNSVLAVYNGDVEVGLSFDDARGTIEDEKPDVGEKVVVFAYSEQIPNDGIVVRSDLPQSLKDAIVEFFLAYAETEEGAEVLDAIYEIGGLRVGNDADLDVVRRADAELGDSFEG